MTRRGKYIVIEGNDGTGKSTQVELLADWLRERGETVQIVEEPGSDDPEKATPVANELRRAIKNANLERSPEINLLLFSSVRRELWLEKIKPALDRGETVIAARNYLSTLAYQGVGEGLSQNHILEITELFTDKAYLEPDIMLILNLNHATRDQRIAMRGELKNPDTFESRSGNFQEKVNQAYEAIARKRNIPLIDASGSVEDVFLKIKNYS